MIECIGWQFLNRFPEERSEYEKYVERITKEKIEIARLKLDKLDFKILNTVCEFKIITSSQLIKLVFVNDQRIPQKFAIKNCSNRLKKLFNLGCIDKFFPSTLTGNGTEPTHVVMGPIGAKILDIKKFRRIRTVNQNWRHTIMANEVIANLSVKYEVQSWKKEIKLEWKDEALRDMFQQPDILICYVNNESKKKYAFVEIDMGTESLDVLVKKVKNYINYFNSNYFQTARWQPYRDKNIAIIPEIFFIMKYKNDAISLKNKILKLDSNILFKVTTLEQIKIPI